MLTYSDFSRRRIDLSPLGLEKGAKRSDYFCTPAGSKIYGWTGIDGIHFCCVKKSGETVFAVSPMNDPGNYVHPVAENFEDFIRLLMACGAAAAEQAHAWNKERFDGFLRENPPTQEAEELKLLLREKLGLTPMEQPFAYIKALQSAFPYDAIPRRPDYWEWVPRCEAEREAPPWRVYWGCGFFEKSRTRPGAEIPVRKDLDWGGSRVLIPAVYSCAAGLAADICVDIDPEKVREFHEKTRNGQSDPGTARMTLDDPTAVRLRAAVTVNGKTLRSTRGFGVVYCPESIEEDPVPCESRWIAEHYGLDRSRCWSIERIFFPWATKKRPQLTSLSIELSEAAKSVPGDTFTARGAGDSFAFTDPVTGLRRTLTVTGWAAQEIDMKYRPDTGAEYPKHCILMEYTLTPPAGRGQISLYDVRPGDQPRRKLRSPYEPQAEDDIPAVSTGIIGGADGPTALVFASPGQPGAVFSSLHFEPTDTVTWQLFFQKPGRESIAVKLI